MLILCYPSKKVLKSCIGKPLVCQETSMFGTEYRSDGKFVGSNRPSITGIKGREFFAEVTMEGGLIKGVK